MLPTRLLIAASEDVLMCAPMPCLCAHAKLSWGWGLQVGPSDVRSGSVPQRRAARARRRQAYEKEEKKEGGGAAASGNQGRHRTSRLKHGLETCGAYTTCVGGQSRGLIRCVSRVG